MQKQTLETQQIETRFQLFIFHRYTPEKLYGIEG